MEPEKLQPVTQSGELYSVPLESAHSGISGSTYDRLAFRPLASGGKTLTAAVLGAIKSKRGAHLAATGAGSALGGAGGSSGASAKLERLIAARRGERPSTGLRDTGSRPVCGSGVGRDGRFRNDEEHLKTMKIMFDFFDTDADGYLTEEQLRMAIASVGIPPSRRLLYEIYSRKGHREPGVGFLLFVEGVEASTTRDPINSDALRRVLRRFENPSRDAPGHLPAHMIRHILCGVENVFGTHLTNEDVNTLFEKFEIDEGSPVEYMEFFKALSSGFLNFPRVGPNFGGAPVGAGASAAAIAGTSTIGPAPPRRP